MLLTGGAGFIGSHTAVEAIQREYDVVTVDVFFKQRRISNRPDGTEYWC